MIQNYDMGAVCMRWSIAKLCVYLLGLLCNVSVVSMKRPLSFLRETFFLFEFIQMPIEGGGGKLGKLFLYVVMKRYLARGGRAHICSCSWGRG